METQNYSHPSVSQELVDLLACPKTREPLILENGKLKTHSSPGQKEYSVKNNIPILFCSETPFNISEQKTQDRVSTAYEEIRFRTYGSRLYHQSISDYLLAQVNHGTLLDLGCGNGYVYELSSLRPELIVGMDLSFDMLSLAQKRMQHLVQGDACKLPFKDEKFDHVMARGLLHHLPRPKDGVQEITRSLKKGGRFVAFEPHRNFLTTLPRILARQTKHFDDDHKNFSVRELRELIEPELEITRIEYVGFLAYPLLAFPDLINFEKWLPFKWIPRVLMTLDGFIGKLPLIKHLSWALLVKARKRIS